MKEKTIKNHVSTMVHLLEQNGHEVPDEVMELMQPLINGEMSMEEHEKWLLKQLEEAEHGAGN